MRATTTITRGPVPRRRSRCSRQPSGRRDSHTRWTDPKGPVTTTIDDGFNLVTDTLDPGGRVLRHRVTDAIAGTLKEDTRYGYSGPGDSPAYTMSTSGGAVSTTIVGPDGINVAYTGTTPTKPLVNGEGHFAGTTNASGTFTALPVADEYGNVTSPSSGRLDWLGTHQRYRTGNNNGLVRMGVRLYDPASGRFSQVDPLEGGSCNVYEYVCGDPVNGRDLDGRGTLFRNGMLGLKCNWWKCTLYFSPPATAKIDDTYNWVLRTLHVSSLQKYSLGGFTGSAVGMMCGLAKRLPSVTRGFMSIACFFGVLGAVGHFLDVGHQAHLWNISWKLACFAIDFHPWEALTAAASFATGSWLSISAFLIGKLGDAHVSTGHTCHDMWG